MKVYCMSCGKGFEYYGEASKPKDCSCGSSFGGEIQKKSKNTKKTKKTVKKISSGGFNVSELVKMVTPEFDPSHRPQAE